jgi:hypothetical protein
VSDELEDGILSRCQKAIDWEKGLIARADLRLVLYREAALLEEQQWRAVEDLRAQAPAVAELMAAELRKGSGTAGILSRAIRNPGRRRRVNPFNHPLRARGR